MTLWLEGVEVLRPSYLIWNNSNLVAFQCRQPSCSSPGKERKIWNRKTRLRALQQGRLPAAWHLCVVIFPFGQQSTSHHNFFAVNTGKTLFFYLGAAVHTHTKSCHLSHKHCAPCEKFMYIKGRRFFSSRGFENIHCMWSKMWRIFDTLTLFL